MKLRTYGAMAILLLLSVSLACANSGVNTAGSGGGDNGVPTIEITPGATLVAVGVQERLFVGPLEPPENGFVALYVHEDFSLDMLAVHIDDISWASYMTGLLDGQRVDLTHELDFARGSGRPEGPGFELNITVPGKGLQLARLEESPDASLYRGELNDLIAGLMVLADGSVYGIAAVEGGDEAVYEYLCVEGGVEGSPDEVTATTCDTGVEVTLTKVN